MNPPHDRDNPPEMHRSCRAEAWEPRKQTQNETNVLGNIAEMTERDCVGCSSTTTEDPCHFQPQRIRGKQAKVEKKAKANSGVARTFRRHRKGALRQRSLPLVHSEAYRADSVRSSGRCSRRSVRSTSLARSHARTHTDTHPQITAAPLLLLPKSTTPTRRSGRRRLQRGTSAQTPPPPKPHGNCGGQAHTGTNDHT